MTDKEIAEQTAVALWCGFIMGFRVLAVARGIETSPLLNDPDIWEMLRQVADGETTLIHDPAEEYANNPDMGEVLRLKLAELARALSRTQAIRARLILDQQNVLNGPERLS